MGPLVTELFPAFAGIFTIRGPILVRSVQYLKGHMENIAVDIQDYKGNKNITIVSVKGYLDTTTASELGTQVGIMLRDNRFKLIIELSGVDYIASAGWGIFISEIKRIRNAKGDLVLAGMRPAVAEVFELLEFNSIMKAFPNIEIAARKAFGDPPDLLPGHGRARR